MSTKGCDEDPSAGHVVVRYWASARAAAGTAEEKIPVDGEVSLSWLMTRLVESHADSRRFPDVLECCAVMVGDRPVGSLSATEVVVRAGDSVEFLPPFAGG